MSNSEYHGGGAFKSVLTVNGELLLVLYFEAQKTIFKYVSPRY